LIVITSADAGAPTNSRAIEIPYRRRRLTIEALLSTDNESTRRTQEDSQSAAAAKTPLLMALARRELVAHID
jgi:hypothetical protein